MARIDIRSNGGGGSVAEGVLQLENGVAIDTTLRSVTDQNNTTSPLKLSTTAVQVESPLRITTDDPSDMYLDCEDGSTNNRFNITRNTASQQVNLNFASNPAGSTTIVGAIRTFTDGVNLGEVVKFREDGQVTFSERVNVEADSLVTTQGSSVIAASTTNANLVIAPNGTGALVASIPDGTATGGNARGSNAVDLQTSRTDAINVASGDYSVVAGGINNRANGTGSFVGGGSNNSTTGLDDYQAIVGGQSNTISQSGGSFIGGGLSNSVNTSAGTGYCVISGGRSNSVTSTYSTISGGQNNTASTATHATVVGGQSNTSSGIASVSGGLSNTASGNYAVALGNTNAVSGRNSVGIGQINTVNQTESYALGYQNTASSQYGSIVGANNSISGGIRNYAFGFQNTSNAVGGYSLAMGINTSANESYSTTFGYYSNTKLYGQISNASGPFSSVGDAQQSLLTARREASLNSAATTVLSLDGTGVTNLIIPSGNNRVWNVVASWTAVVTSITGTATGVSVGDVATECNLFAFKKIAGVSSIVGTVTSVASHNDASMATAAMGYTAGASQELIPTFSAPIFVGGGSLTIRVVLKLMLTEVAY
jgi:hypothetical protein